MFPSEMVILMAIAENKTASKELLTGQTDVIGEYIGYLYDSLVKRGYLSENRFRGYQLTLTGKKELLEFLHKNDDRAELMIKRLQQLGIKSSHKIDKLREETIEVK